MFVTTEYCIRSYCSNALLHNSSKATRTLSAQLSSHVLEHHMLQQVTQCSYESHTSWAYW